MFLRSEEKSPGDFWKELEEKIGEKVLERGMGKYISGWSDFNKAKQANISGLVVITSGGFRFYYFQHKSWFDAMIKNTGTDNAKEIEIFIPNERIVSTQLVKETKWWKKVFFSSVPLLVINFTNETGEAKELVFEAIIFSKHN